MELCPIIKENCCIPHEKNDVYLGNPWQSFYLLKMPSILDILRSKVYLIFTLCQTRFLVSLKIYTFRNLLHFTFLSYTITHLFFPPTHTGVLYALIFGQVTNIISQLQKGSNEFTDKMSSIKNFNTIYKMPPKVAKRLEDYFVATWTVTKGTDEQEVKN